MVLLVGLLAAGCGSDGGSDEARGDRGDEGPPRREQVTQRGAAGATARTVELPAGDDRVVERVVDGDTIVVGGGERVRLIGIDTPESVDPRRPVECLGEEAAEVTESLLPPGTGVRLVFDVERVDRYDRTLAYAYRLDDGLFVNLELVERGYAQPSTFPPNVEHADELVEAAAAAREAGSGLWSAC